MRPNLIINAYELHRGDWPETEIKAASLYIRKGYYAPARPEGFYSIWYRLRATWLVFTGQADALVWPHQGYIPKTNRRGRPRVLTGEM